MNKESAEAWLRDGCGRCDNYQTPACKVLLWTAPLERLRALVREAGLVEEMKWGSPTYTLDGKNVVMLVALKDCCALQFFKGAIMEDPDGVLESPGPNSHFARMIKFRSLGDLEARLPAARACLEQAIALEKAGAKVERPAEPEALPEELAAVLAANPAVKQAFEALTPGRRRSHVLHVAGAKQGATRAKRAEACAALILAGRGFNER